MTKWWELVCSWTSELDARLFRWRIFKANNYDINLMRITLNCGDGTSLLLSSSRRRVVMSLPTEDHQVSSLNLRILIHANWEGAGQSCLTAYQRGHKFPSRSCLDLDLKVVQGNSVILHYQNPVKLRVHGRIKLQQNCYCNLFKYRWVACLCGNVPENISVEIWLSTCGLDHAGRHDSIYTILLHSRLESALMCQIGSFSSKCARECQPNNTDSIDNLN